MCFLLLALQQNKEFPFILAANRDEYYQRPTAPLGFWSQQPSILAGQDLEQGGTWMGVTKYGKFAALTNYREVKSGSATYRSRGLLVTDFLANDIHSLEFARKLELQAHEFDGFNLIFGELDGALYYFSNRSNEKTRPLIGGNYGLSNHLLDTSWPKVDQGKKRFKTIIHTEEDGLESTLFDLLSDQNNADASELPDTGISKDFERLLSSIFIKSDQYGTRCSSVILMDKNHRLTFIEKTFDQDSPAETRTYHLEIKQ